MKPTTGSVRVRRIDALPARARLNLQRRPRPEPEDGVDAREPSSFWKWVLLVALLHVLVIGGLYIYMLFAPRPAPRESFISLLPPGDTVKGTVGAQRAHKLGATTPAAPSHHAPPPAAAVAPPSPIAPPTPVKPPPPAPVADSLAPVVVKPAPPKPAPPKPKVKVDLHLVDRADATADDHSKPVKHHSPKPEKIADHRDDTENSPDNTGLSKEQIAEKLGDKLDASGSRNALKSGTSGAQDGHENKFQDFYNLISQQIVEAWTSPNTSTKTEPLVGIHVERDGRIPAESVHLIRSSGDPVYDNAAIETMRRIGFLREPLPEGCPPDISINFNPNP